MSPNHQSDFNKQFDSLLNNAEFRAKLIEFRLKWGIPIQGFSEVGDEYFEWAKRNYEYKESIRFDFDFLAKRCKGLYSRVNSEFTCLLGCFAVFDSIPIKPGGSFPEFKKVLFGGLPGFLEITFTLPFFAEKEELSLGEEINSQISAFFDKRNSLNKYLEDSNTPPKPEDSFLGVAPGNFADIIARTQTYEEWLIDLGRASLREAIRNLKDFEIKEYADKNKHIISPIGQAGMFLMNRNLFHIAEHFWQGITEETKLISQETGYKFNSGISLGNTGVCQIVQGKVKEGLVNLYKAHEEDRVVLEKLQNPQSDSEKNLITSILYTQFETRLLERLINDIISKNKSLCSQTIAVSDLQNLIDNLTPNKRLFLFGIIWEVIFSIQDNNDVPNLISRGDLLRGFADLTRWLEDEIRSKDATIPNLYQGLVYLGGIDLPTGDLISKTLDELLMKISLAEQGTNRDIVNAQVTILIRNFTGHNFQSSNHQFFENADKYLSQVISLILKLKQDGKI